MARAMRTLAVLAALSSLAVAFAGCSEEGEGGPGSVDETCMAHAQAGSGNPHVVLATTLGNMTAEIFVDGAPNTGMNFVKLAENGTLDGSPFHRIITDFMMQGGDYTNRNGSGGRANADCDTGDGDIVDEFSPELRHAGKGILSMANAGADSASSQFFITFKATPHLDAYDAQGNRKDCAAVDQFGRPINSCHAVFGQVTEGLDVLDRVDAEAASGGGQPRIPVTLLNATVEWPSA